MKSLVNPHGVVAAKSSSIRPKRAVSRNEG